MLYIALHTDPDMGCDWFPALTLISGKFTCLKEICHIKQTLKISIMKMGDA